MSYFNRVKLTDNVGNVINPTQDESIVLLRRIAKLLESNANTDPLMRQRVTIAAIDNGSGTITSAGTALPVTISSLVAGSANTGNVVVQYGAASTAAGIDSRFSMIDTARNAYATGIRSNLKWS